MQIETVRHVKQLLLFVGRSKVRPCLSVCVCLELIIIAAAAIVAAATSAAIVVERSEHKLAQDEAKDGERDRRRDVHDRDLLLLGERRRSVHVRVLAGRRSAGRRRRLGLCRKLLPDVFLFQLQAEKRFLCGENIKLNSKTTPQSSNHPPSRSDSRGAGWWRPPRASSAPPTGLPR